MRQMITPSLRIRTLLFILLAVAPLTAVALFNAAEQRAASAAQVQTDALRLARVAAVSHEQLIEGARQTLIALSQLPAVRNGDAQACNVLFAGLLRETPYYANLAVLDLNGDVLCSAVPFTGPINVADRPWFQQAIQTRIFTISEDQIGRITRKPVLTTAYPVTDEAGGLVRIVTIAIDIAWLNQLVATAPLPAGASFTVLDHAGTVLAHSPDPEVWVGRAAEGAPLFSAIQSQHGTGTIIAPGLDGQARLFGFTSLRTSEGNPAAYLAVGIPAAQAFAETDRALLRNLIVLSALAVLGLTAAWLLADRWLMQRLRRLAQTADRLGAGEWSTRTGQGEYDSELGMLARAFDNMAAALEEYDARRRSAEAALMLDITERKQVEEALRQTRDQLLAVLDAAPAAISWIGADLRYRGINRYLAESLGRPDTAVAGEPIGFLGTSPELADFVRDFFARGLSEDAREVATQNSGVRRSYLVVARKYQAGQAAVLVGVDITERKQAEKSLWESRAMLQQILDTIPQAVFWKDKASVYLGCNQVFARAAGLTNSEQVVGKTDFDLPLPREKVEVYRADDAQVVASGIPKQHIVEPLQQADGTQLWIHACKLPLLDAHREVQGVLGVYEDITERKRAEEALRQYTEQLHELTARLADAQEGERRRLAQELHDRVGQNLTALSINLSIVRDLLPPEPAAKIGPRLEDSLGLVSETVEHIRDVMAELRPPVLDDYGLLAALRWYGQRFAQRTGLAITTQGADPTPRLPLATEMTLFRIAQEALTNAARHAQARQVTITLEALAADLRLTIADDGTGFDLELRTQPNGRRTLGLLTMAERAESVGARLVIDAAPGRGTRVIVVVGSGL